MSHQRWSLRLGFVTFQRGRKAASPYGSSWATCAAPGFPRAGDNELTLYGLSTALCPDTHLIKAFNKEDDKHQRALSPLPASFSLFLLASPRMPRLPEMQPPSLQVTPAPARPAQQRSASRAHSEVLPSISPSVVGPMGMCQLPHPRPVPQPLWPCGSGRRQAGSQDMLGIPRANLCPLAQRLGRALEAGCRARRMPAQEQVSTSPGSPSGHWAVASDTDLLPPARVQTVRANPKSPGHRCSGPLRVMP